MTNEQLFYRLMDKCNIYFEDSLISKELIVQKYAKFFAVSFGQQAHSLSVVQHTGSVCFDVVSFLIAALGCFFLNETDNDNIIRSFTDGQMVMLTSITGKHKERRHWRGLLHKTHEYPFETELSDFDNADYAYLEQPEKLSREYIPRNQWYRISPYNGPSTRADGRGIRSTKLGRNEFISYLFDVPVASVPSVIDVSTVIVTDREAFKRIANGIRIEYGKGKSVGLLDIVTASYYTSNLEEHQYGENPAKTEPILKITSRISAARDLVLDKSGNRTIGFIVIGTNTIAMDDSELAALLERKSLKFSMITASVDSDVAKKIIRTHDEAPIFVCTKEFLLQHSATPNVDNPITTELYSQIDNIIKNEVIPVSIDGMCYWQEIKTLKDAIFTIKNSEISNEEKDDFIITAYSMINLILTAVFPLERINMAVENGEFATMAIAPSAKIDELLKLADQSMALVDQFHIVADTIYRLYHSALAVCPKHEAIVKLLKKYSGQKIAIVVPKAYYIDILKTDNEINERCSAIVTANRFNRSVQYNTIIVAGNFLGTHFNPLNCHAASNILVLLYDGEEKLFRNKKQESDFYEKSINARLNIKTDDKNKNDFVGATEIADIASVVAIDSNLSQYINTITTFDAHSFVQRISGYSGNAPSTEVYAIGQFLSGEQIMFTRYYQAVVFFEADGTVSEKDVDSLHSGDIMVFAKRDDNTKNMVDYIYDQLQWAGKFTDKVTDATEKSQYWKLALSEYKDNNDLSYKDVAKRLRNLGLSIQEVSVRQWLIEESHIVGPRKENTLKQIAILTQDPFLLENTHSYFEACEIVRKQRKNILKLIGNVIVDKLRGLAPTDDKLLKFIFENVENLSESLELDKFSVLDKPVPVPTAFTNRPINDMEVTL